MASSNRIGAHNREDLPDQAAQPRFRHRQWRARTAAESHQAPAVGVRLAALPAGAGGDRGYCRHRAIARGQTARLLRRHSPVGRRLSGVCGLDQRRRARLDARLAKDGRLLPGTLTSCRFVRARKENTGSLAPGASLAIRYRFAAPDGQAFEKHETVEYLPADLKTLPPAGMKLLALYIDREACTAL